MEKGKTTSMELPRITGHELSGIVEEADNNAGSFLPGDRVVVAPTVPCLTCAMCKVGYHEMCLNIKVMGYHRDGGFAELVKVQPDVIAAGCVLKVPENVSLEAAALTEPFSCAVNCLELSPVTKSGKVLIMGAGPLGLIIADLASYQGAKEVILADISKAQLKKSVVSNAKATINLSEQDIAEKTDDLTDGLGMDLVICACPAPEAQQLSLKLVARRGMVNFFGGLPRDSSVVPLDTNLIHYKECIVTGTHGSAPRHVARALELQAAGTMDLGKYIEKTFPLARINQALELAQGQGRLKIVINPGGGVSALKGW